jgi:hypothetical protein
MAHFAQIDENNVVQQVLVIDQDEINTYRWGNPASWIQTSYNTRNGVYYTPGTNDPDPDQLKAFRKNYAGIGYTWDGVGFAPPKPEQYPSWVLNTFSYQWETPVPKPEDTDTVYYTWDESTVNWVAVEQPSVKMRVEVI